MVKYLDIQLAEATRAYSASGIEEQVDYQKFHLYSIVTHSTAIEGSTVTELENQLLFDEGIAAKSRSLTEQMMNVDLKDAHLLNAPLQNIYLAIADHPEITHSKLMGIFHISESTAKRATKELKRLGFIKSEGSDKTGKWIILK